MFWILILSKNVIVPKCGWINLNMCVQEEEAF